MLEQYKYSDYDTHNYSKVPLSNPKCIWFDVYHARPDASATSISNIPSTALWNLFGDINKVNWWQVFFHGSECVQFPIDFHRFNIILEYEFAWFWYQHIRLSNTVYTFRNEYCQHMKWKAILRMFIIMGLEHLYQLNGNVWDPVKHVRSVENKHSGWSNVAHTILISVMLLTSSN